MTDSIKNLLTTIFDGYEFQQGTYCAKRNLNHWESGQGPDISGLERQLWHIRIDLAEIKALINKSRTRTKSEVDTGAASLEDGR